MNAYVSCWKSRKIAGPKIAAIRIAPNPVNCPKHCISAHGLFSCTFPLPAGPKSCTDTAKNVGRNGIRKNTYVDTLRIRNFISNQKNLQNIPHPFNSSHPMWPRVFRPASTATLLPTHATPAVVRRTAAPCHSEPSPRSKILFVIPFFFCDEFLLDPASCATSPLSLLPVSLSLFYSVLSVSSVVNPAYSSPLPLRRFAPSVVSLCL